jgi:dihydrofolate synthase/folylpolyglutamate synthase
MGGRDPGKQVRVSDHIAYQNALRRFHERSDYEKGTITNPFGRAGDEGARGLARVRALLAELGNPQKRYDIVHVAGSKGKGSTCAFLSTILTGSGYRTGRYISPHLHTLRERIAVDDLPMPEAEFTASLDRVLRACERVESNEPELGKITAFEISTAMAFDYFAERACELAVIEVGLGGTWDATNVVDPEITVITLLDYEHTEILGDTLAEIAENKAGIIKPGRPVLTQRQAEEGMHVIELVASTQRAPLLIEGKDWTVDGDWKSARISTTVGEIGPVRLGLSGNHQLHNAGLAAMSASLLAERGRVGITAQNINTGLAETFWPARFEVVRKPGEATIVIDGAHTGASGAALVAALDDQFPDQPIDLIFGMLGGKDAAAMMAHFRSLTGRISLVRPANPRAMSFEQMERAALQADLTATCFASLEEAMTKASEQAQADTIIVVTGSLSFAGEAREIAGLAVTEKFPF